ncbi:Ca2+-transporting ATPase [Halanaerobium saccharolyticum]|uniref:P-type Ca(2+) transporter n=1 Tax=Halanaerobium saccharolyticum TaxID=43595 RepID=A0A4R7Z2S0_9FIRM|nr:HAD-IC family P-type ATPase [Halanaerobium saccharolyticum]RAK08178.1 Ca2+-transporting ATPase [Halanaerobium saccharolyticum]TDW04385.1 Ca2+-transporting ATPase [Halanaerobium saccharolyticum]TDX59676.1 Ca2+-transporting ATPase [Halanaerobium saccharolyticum]
MAQNYYKQKIDEIIKKFNTDLTQGLKESELKKKQEKYGKNKLRESRGVSFWQILFNQIKDLIIIILIISAALAFLIGDNLEGFAILAVIVFNTIIGFVTEYQAQKAVASLKNVLSKKALVLRSGSKKEIEAAELVPGDIIFIEEGDQIPADSRLVDSQNLTVNEASLTGESESVSKNAEAEIAEDKTLAERENMVYMGTTVARGKGKAVVTATAEETEIGKIGAMLDETKEGKTPLEKRLDKLGKSLVKITLVVIAILTVIGIIMGRPVYETVKTGIALAIAAVPEGLPIIATITLAIGMKKMVEHNALVRELLAVETLGSVTTICTDKTGTITENQMTLRKIFLNDQEIEISGTGYKPEGEFSAAGSQIDLKEADELKLALKASLLCTSADLVKEDGNYKVLGEATEGALLTAGRKAGFSKESLKKEGYQKLAEIPFNSSDMYMAVSYSTAKSEEHLYLKGSPDVVLEMCDSILIDGEIEEFSQAKKEEIKKENKKLGEEGLRILGVAFKTGENLDSESELKESIESGLTFLALTAIIDPPRQSVKKAIEETKKAGIKTKMITGDQMDTAASIAWKVGIEGSNNVISGQEISKASGSQLKDLIKSNSVFSRVTPENKLQIIEVLSEEKEITAMTGDGVNDAPALKKADIGVSMGERGTSVAREASDMVLLDDDFATIVTAVREGRVIFDNIQKFIYFLFSNNLSKIIYIFLGIIFNLPLPLVAMQILWINVVIDVFPALSLAWEKEEDNIMERKATPERNIMDKAFKKKVTIHSLILAAGPMLLYVWALNSGYSLELSRTLSFSVLAFTQLFHVFNARRKSGMAFDKTVLENKYLWLSVGIGFVFQLAAIYLPALQGILSTVPVEASLWLPSSLAIIIPMAVIQFLNWKGSN